MVGEQSLQHNNVAQLVSIHLQKALISPPAKATEPKKIATPSQNFHPAPMSKLTQRSKIKVFRSKRILLSVVTQFDVVQTNQTVLKPANMASVHYQYSYLLSDDILKLKQISNAF